MPMQLFVGDVVMLKKPHPCGGYNWEILRTGMDFRIKCLTCGHSVMLPRTRLEKGIKKIVKQALAPEAEQE
ncbi:MAG TPA: DUF951 domain-containing protein [Firmicutes bacterium]|jgi:hypothetical protein|nr:DUF951 domain-containing protein [Bacillota bacterium]